MFAVQAVDSFTAKQLTKLEEKVPAIKSEPAEVITYLTDSKDAISTKISNGHAAVKSRISEGKEAITSRVVASKEAVVSRLQAGTEAVSQTRIVILAVEKKDALVVKVSEGKEAVVTRIAAGKDALYSSVQSSASAVANTRAGILVGSGLDCTLSATENLVDYLIPAEENEKELLSESTKVKESIEMTTIKSNEEGTVTEAVEEEVVVVKDCQNCQKCSNCLGEVEESGRIDRVRTLSRKVKLRIYYRSLRRLHGVQQQSKATLEQLKAAVQLVSCVLTFPC